MRAFFCLLFTGETGPAPPPGGGLKRTAPRGAWFIGPAAGPKAAAIGPRSKARAPWTFVFFKRGSGFLPFFNFQGRRTLAPGPRSMAPGPGSPARVPRTIEANNNAQRSTPRRFQRGRWLKKTKRVKVQVSRKQYTVKTNQGPWAFNCDKKVLYLRPKSTLIWDLMHGQRGGKS